MLEKCQYVRNEQSISNVFVNSQHRKPELFLSCQDSTKINNNSHYPFNPNLIYILHVVRDNENQSLKDQWAYQIHRQINPWEFAHVLTVLLVPVHLLDGIGEFPESGELDEVGEEQEGDLHGED